MEVKKTTFALFFGNRGVFPASLMAMAREELPSRLKALGHDVLMMDADATRVGAVETPEEGRKYARFLDDHRGEFGGVILSLPNFGDEDGAVVALRDANVPILVQAYPDDLDKMGPAARRDAFCGKFSIMDVFCQHGLKFTALKPHTVSPMSERFAGNVDLFDRICRVVGGMRRLTVGALGARTTAFKTVRIDEITLQRHGISMETLDLSDIFHRMNSLSPEEDKCKAKAEVLRAYTCWTGVPDSAFDKITRLGVVIDDVIEEYGLDVVAPRCWVELQSQLGISACSLVSELNNRGIPCSCEVDVGNAVTMAALRLASSEVTTCLDWNNNYGDKDDKCILFHCGPVPTAMMTDSGRVTDHLILANAVGPGCGYGTIVGRIRPTDITYGSMLTEDGKMKFYLGEGEFTDDPIPEDFFGCAGVAKIEGLQGVLQRIGYLGHRHHTSVTPTRVAEPVRQAFERYLGYELTVF